MSDDDFERVYECHDWLRNSASVRINDEDGLVLFSDFDELRSVLVEMERMARDIEKQINRSRSPIGFSIKRNKRLELVFRVEPLGKRYYRSLKAFVESYAHSDRYLYSPHVWAVCEAARSLGLYPDVFTFGHWSNCVRSVGEVPGRGHAGKTYGEVFNELIGKIAEILRTTEFERILNRRKLNAARNKATALAIEHQAFENKSRRLVLMLCLGFREECRHKVTLKEMQNCRDRFFNNRRMNKLLRGIVDYIWTLEEGEQSGLHLHALLFYTADSCHDVYIAKQIGEYWVNVVTKGKGAYWNSNADKARHAKCGNGVGTGQINWNEHEKREALRKIIRYITKAEQFLKMKYDERCRAFGTSQVKEKKKSGRPRTKELDGG